MDISKVKEIIGKVSFLKSYSSLLVPAVITIVALLLFIPTRLISSRLRQQISKETIAIGTEIDSLGEDVVPRDQWQQAQQQLQQYAKDVNQVERLARHTTERQLLSYTIFPKPRDTSRLLYKDFGERFRQGLRDMLGAVNARDCPTQAEIERSLKNPALSRRSRGQVVYGRRSSRRGSDVEEQIKDVLCRDKAQAIRFYANPEDLSGYRFWSEYEYTSLDDAVEDCWYSQLGYWIIEDVVSTIAAVDEGSNSVFTSPVKRLMKVSFSNAQSGRKTVSQDLPHYILSADDELTESLTARKSDDYIDVVHFKVVVLARPESVLPFIRQLCSGKEHVFNGYDGQGPRQVFKHNQITVLESNIRSIDRTEDAHELYRYGEDAVVELELFCEYIFNKAGYEAVMPESVKELFKEETKER